MTKHWVVLARVQYVEHFKRYLGETLFCTDLCTEPIIYDHYNNIVPETSKLEFLYSKIENHSCLFYSYKNTIGC